MDVKKIYYGIGIGVLIIILLNIFTIFNAGRIFGTESLFSRIEQTENRITEQIDIIGTKVNEFGGVIQTINARTGELEKQISIVDGGIQNIGAELRIIKSNITEFRTKYNSIIVNSSEIGKRLGIIETGITELEDSTSKITTDIQQSIGILQDTSDTIQRLGNTSTGYEEYLEELAIKYGFTINN